MSWMVLHAWPNLRQCYTFEILCACMPNSRILRYSLCCFEMRCHMIGKSCSIFARIAVYGLRWIFWTPLFSVSVLLLYLLFNSFLTNHKVEFHTDFALILFLLSIELLELWFCIIPSCTNQPPSEFGIWLYLCAIQVTSSPFDFTYLNLHCLNSEEDIIPGVGNWIDDENESCY